MTQSSSGAKVSCWAGVQKTPGRKDPSGCFASRVEGEVPYAMCGFTRAMMAFFGIAPMILSTGWPFL